LDFYQPKAFGKPKDFVEFGTANLDSQELKKFGDHQSPLPDP